MNGSLRVSGLKKKIGGFTLEADFEIASGERVALIGRSGSGKTTLLRLISGLEALDPQGTQGRIFLGNREVTSLDPEQRRVGFVFQDQALFPALSVLENVAFGLRFQKLARREREQLALSWLEKVRMENQAGSRISILSGGERQRVAFLRAIIWKPDLILMDEPFSALDREMRRRLQEELIELHRLWPVPMLLVSHDETDLQVLATERIFLEEDPLGQRRKFMKAPNNQRVPLA